MSGGCDRQRDDDERIVEARDVRLNRELREARDELANEKAAHAEAERLLSEARVQLAASRSAHDEAVQRVIEAERRENEARANLEHVEEDREEFAGNAAKWRQDAQEARDRLSRVKAAVDAVRGAPRIGTFTDQQEAIDAVDRALAGVEARPVLTEDRAREMAEEAIEASMNRSTVVLRDNMTALLLRMSRGDFGEAPREPAAKHQPGCAHGGCDLCNGEPRTDLAALADAIEANGRTWQRVEPSTVAQALRAVDRRMRTLEAAVTALAASVEHVQATAGIGERRHVVASVGDAEGVAALAGMDPPSKVAGPWTEVEPGIWKRPTVGIRDDYAGSVRVPCENTVAWTAFRDAVETGEWSPVADQGEWHGDVLIGVPFVKELCDEALCAAGWTLQDATEKPASQQQGDVVPDLVLGHIDGQPIRARYTGVTPTEPRKP